MKAISNIMGKRSSKLLAAVLCSSVSVTALASAPAVKCRVELDRDVLYAGQTQKAIVKITLDAPKYVRKADRPPVNLSIVLDRSGSMSGKKLEKAKDAAIQALRRLDDNDMFSLVIYDSNIKTVVPAQSAANTEWIEAQIRKINAGSSTALFGGVSQGAAEIRKSIKKKYVHRIILLSDGLANVGPSSPADLGRLGAGLIKEGISVSTIGVGTDYNEDLMTTLSRKSDGNSYFVEKSQDLAKIFTVELGDVLSVVAQKVNLTIECPSGVTPLRIIGREGRIRNNRVELYLNQLYGGQEKYALLEVEIEAGKDGETKDVATANVSYLNPKTQKQLNTAATGKGKYSKSKDAVQQSLNSAVIRANLIMDNAGIQNDAVAEADKGDKKKGARLLRSSAAKLRFWGNKNNDKALIEKAEEVENQADDLELDLTPGLRKEIITDSYQDMNQQTTY